jgi:hypothetical protein
VQYLIETYRRLESAAHRPLVSPYSLDVESALADVQLFGSGSQVAAAKEFAVEMAEHRPASLDVLLLNLRNDLRTELQLENVDGRLMHLRIVAGDKD